MSEYATAFSLVKRGYDPTVVDQHLARLTRELSDLKDVRAQESADTARLREEIEQLRDAVTSPSTLPYEQLGERVGQMLALARDEAAELVQRGQESVAAQRAQVEQESAAKLGEASSEARRLVDEAQRNAEELLESARTEAATIVHETQSQAEEHRASLAKAAADFEATLGSRRQQVEAEFAARMAQASERLEQTEKLAAESQAKAEHVRKEAQLDARRILGNAELEAQTLVSEAKSTAARLRAESEREVAAAAQRRDSINSQLANVRQVLSALTGQPGGEGVPEQPEPMTPAASAEDLSTAFDAIGEFTEPAGHAPGSA